VTAPFAYVPRRRPLQLAGALAALVYCFSLAVVAFAFSNPIVLAGAGVAVVCAAAVAGAARAVFSALRLGAVLALTIVAVNALVTHRGLTVLVRGGDVPVLGRMDLTLESVAAGGVIALRILVVLGAFALYSACVDPDKVLRLVRPLAHRSALTASLVARMVPVAVADASRLGEAADLRGPAAAAVGRAALARRLVAGSLDRAVDVAATLELRGYGIDAPPAAARPRRSRRDGRLLACGVAIGAGALVARAVGIGGFDAYPTVAIDADAPTLVLAAVLPLVAVAPLVRRPARRPAGRSPRIAEAAGA
jgi:energy-coupling factor transport system permease protein